MSHARAVDMPCQSHLPRRETLAPEGGPLSNNTVTRMGFSSVIELLATPSPHVMLFREFRGLEKDRTPVVLHLPQVYRTPPSLIVTQCSTPAETSMICW
jgi:hypothetical protein